MRLTGEVAIVTGSTSGLGRAIAGRFAREGARVVVTGRDVDRGEAAVAGITAAGGQATFVRADLADEAGCAAVVEETVRRYGAPTVLVNNAITSTGGRDGAVTDVSADTWLRVLRVNLLAAAWLCRAAIPHMARAGGGAIVNLTSRAASRGTPGHAAYSASKGALEALTRSIAVDYAAANIRCNAIAPGYVMHDVRDATLDDARRAALEGMHLTRVSLPEDIADAAVFLASRESATITGIVLPVDGGSTSARGRVLG